MLSDEQMSKRWLFPPLNDEQMSNWVGVKQLPGEGTHFCLDWYVFPPLTTDIRYPLMIMQQCIRPVGCWACLFHKM